MILLTEDQIDMIAERIAAKLERHQQATYTPKQAAAELQVCERTVRRMIEAGQIKRIPGTNRVIVPASEITKLLTTHGR
jgi:excisionase family DNA binding protein